jgi:hypothetical protein
LVEILYCGAKKYGQHYRKESSEHPHGETLA